MAMGTGSSDTGDCGGKTGDGGGKTRACGGKTDDDGGVDGDLRVVNLSRSIDERT